MRNTFFFIIIALFPSFIWCQEPIITTGKIKQVVLYRNGAFAKSESTVKVVKGPNIIEFRGLPRNINKESVQVGGKGLFTINSITHSAYSKELDTLDKKSKSNLVIQKRDSLYSVLSDLKNDYEIAKNEYDVLINNQIVGSETTGLKLIDLKTAMDYYAPRFAEFKIFSIANKTKQDTVQKKINALMYELQNLSKASDSESSIIIDLTAETEGEIQLTIDFLVPNCGWNPTYDIRSDGVSDKLMIAYKANVWQITGIDWKDIELTLSTGNPTQNNNFTKAYRRYFAIQETYSKTNSIVSNVYNSKSQSIPTTIGTHRTLNGNVDRIFGNIKDETGEPLPFVNIQLMDKNNKLILAVQSDLDGFFSMKPVTPEAEYIVCSYVGFANLKHYLTSTNYNIIMRQSYSELQTVEVSYQKPLMKKEADKPSYTTYNTMTNTEFKINTRYTILSDGKENQVEINKSDFNTMYQYYAAPELNPQVFLTAKLIGIENSGFEPGPINVFLNGNYVTTSTLQVPTTDDTTEVSLGYDKSIVLQRERIKNKSEKTTLGSKREEVFAYNLNFKNTKNIPIQIRVEEQIPIAKSNNVEVTNLKFENGSFNQETGIVTWLLTLKPREKTTLSYEYKISYPAKSKITIY